MDEAEESKVTRRHLLHLLAAASVALTAPARAEQRSRKKKQATKTRAPASLYILVNGLIGCNDTARLKRIAFDRNPVDTINSAYLNPEQWKVFVEMDAKTIGDTVYAELQAARDAGGAAVFKRDFDAFLKCWPDYCDGYDPNPEWCKTDNGNCHRGGNAGDTPRYYKPGPHVAGVEPYQDGKFIVHGEGFLPGALVEVWKENTFNNGTPHMTYGDWTPLPSTFRCSQLAFEPRGLSKGNYEVGILNRSGDKSESHRLKLFGKLSI